jgi:magnesium transporter
MSKLIKKRSAKAGLPPGSLVYIGDKKTAKAKITVIDYDSKKFSEQIINKVEECFAFKKTPSVTWINIDGLEDVDVLKKLGNEFNIHPLILEDMLNTDQRPKMEDLGKYVFIVIKMLSLDEQKIEIVSEQVSFILSKNFVISIQESAEGDAFNAVRERIRARTGRHSKMGTDYLVYSLVDAIVDNYFIILENLGERIEELEEKVVSNPQPDVLKKIHGLKTGMIFLRRAVWPLREMLSQLERGESALIKSQTRIYFKDIYDHTIQIMDTVETFRDILQGILDIYISGISNKLNEVMKVLTVIATIFMPLTFLAGVYGMNFHYMPELGWKWGYSYFWIIILISGILMFIYFRKKKWV